MGFSFRKSVKLGGGVRLNLSSKGLGVSGGVKGARMSVGPRGVSVYGGKGPLRYQKHYSGRSGTTSAGTEPGVTDESKIPEIKGGELGDIKQVEKPLKGLANILVLTMLYNLWYFWDVVEDPITTIGFVCFAIINSSLMIWFVKSKETYSIEIKGYDLYAESEKTEKQEDKLRLMREAWTHYRSDEIQDNYIQYVSYYKDHQRLYDALGDFYDIESPGIKWGRAQCLYNLKKYEDCLSEVPNEEYFDGHSQYIEVLYLKAACFVGKKEYDKALEIIKQGLRKRKAEYTEQKRHLKLLEAEVFERMGDVKKAIKLVNGILKEVPEFMEAVQFKEELVKKSA